MPRQNRRLGWKPDLPDHRDFMYAAMAPALAALPAKVDLRPVCPPVYNQGQLGSCTANGIAGAIEFDQIKQKATEFTPSRLFIYYNERVIENTVIYDAGAQIRDGIKSVATLGVCPETLWPYADDHPANDGDPCATCTFAQKPPAAAYAEALNHKIQSYRRVPRLLAQMKSCLAAGYPFVFGFTCYDNLPFESTDGVIPLPGPNNSVIGGHCVDAVGYDDSINSFIIRNSWGDAWGVAGYGFMVYDWLQNEQLSDDLWTIRSV
jgi:C1A family cysteine protease